MSAWVEAAGWEWRWCAPCHEWHTRAMGEQLMVIG